MDIGSIFLLLAILILVVIYVFRPFFTLSFATTGLDNRKEEDSLFLNHQYSLLLIKKDRLLKVLQDFEIDNTMGKIPEEDYSELRAELMTSGARVLRELDDIEEKIKKSSEEAEKKQLADKRTGGMKFTASGKEDPIEEMVNARRRLREEKSAGFCPKCGKVIQKSDVYCPKCGSKVFD